MPAGVWRRAFSTSARPTWRMRCWSPRPVALPSTPSLRQLVSRPLGVRVELLEQELGHLGEVDRIAVDPQAAGIEAGEVEQLAGELRQPVDLLAHAPEELAPGRVVELLLDEELEVAAQREQRRPQLVRRVGDELAAGVLEAGEALAHAFEGAGELAELVGARVDDRLVELAVRDAFGRPLETTDPPREEPCSRIAQEQCGRKREESGDEQAMLDELDAPQGVLDRVRDENDVLPVRRGLGSLRELAARPTSRPLASESSRGRGPQCDRIRRRLRTASARRPLSAMQRSADSGARLSIVEDPHARVRGGRVAGSEPSGVSDGWRRPAPGDLVGDPRHLVLAESR